MQRYDLTSNTDYLPRNPRTVTLKGRDLPMIEPLDRIGLAALLTERVRPRFSNRAGPSEWLNGTA